MKKSVCRPRSTTCRFCPLDGGAEEGLNVLTVQCIVLHGDSSFSMQKSAVLFDVTAAPSS